MDPSQVETQMTKSADGTAIAWYDFGGSGPDLLLAHATGFCAKVWTPVVNRLLDSFHCIAYDARGSGLSNSPDYGREGWDWARYADDADAVLNAAGISNAFGAGHSCGGASEVLLEERKPGTFRALSLYEPVIFPVDPPSGPDPERDLAIKARKRRATFSSRAEAIEQFTTRGPFTKFDREALDAYIDFGFEKQSDGSITLRLKPDDEAEIYVMASGHDGFVRLDEVKCPVAVLRGSESLAFTEDEVKAVVERLPDARFTQLDGLGHFGPLENPEQFAGLLKEALS